MGWAFVFDMRRGKEMGFWYLRLKTYTREML